MNINYKSKNDSIDLNDLSIVEIKNSYLFLNYYNNLNSIKNNIENYLDKWDKFKKFTNNYEKVLFINEYNKPISRSFFKLLEIIINFDLINKKEAKYIFSNNAEGPGGFIDALFYFRKNKNDLYYANTLTPTDHMIPNWNKLKKKINNCNIKLYYNDIYKIKDVNLILNNFTKDKADLVTCDGGFDFSKNFNEQEKMSYRIILSEIVLILGSNKIGGSCIIKVFDIFTIFTIKLIYILSTFYKETNFFKPLTSRQANSEKYIVCKGFIGCSVKQIDKLKLLLYNFNTKLNNIDIKNIKISNDFMLFIDKVNKTFMEKQIECINNTINIIKNPKEFNSEECLKNQIKLASQWYSKYL